MTKKSKDIVFASALRTAIGKYRGIWNNFQAHDLGENVTGGEALFVPRNADSSEDEGWAISLAYEAETDRSKLLVINSQDFESAPVQTAEYKLVDITLKHNTIVQPI